MVAAVIFGLLFGIIAFVILSILGIGDGIWLALIAFAVSSGLMYIYIIFEQKRIERCSLDFEKHLSSKLICSANGNVRIDGRIMNTNIFFCEDGVVLAAFDRKPYRVTGFLKDKIAKAEYDGARIYLLLKDEKEIIMMIPEIERIMEALEQSGWM